MKTGVWIGAAMLIAAGAQVHAGAYIITRNGGDVCAGVAAWANGRPSEVGAVAWRTADKVGSPDARDRLKLREHLENVGGDMVFVQALAESRELVFVKTRRSTYDYRDNQVFVLSPEGGRTCFVNGAINDNRYCQDELHEQLPGSDADFQWQPGWRMKSELLTWRGQIYATDLIEGGPYIVVWKSPPGFRLDDESAPPPTEAVCVLEK